MKTLQYLIRSIIKETVDSNNLSSQLSFNGIVVVKSLKENPYAHKGDLVPFVDIGTYYTVIPYANMDSVLLFNKNDFEVDPEQKYGGSEYAAEIEKAYHSDIMPMVSQGRVKYVIDEKENDDNVSRRRHIRVTFEDGDTLSTPINGTKQEILRYYVNKRFNMGSGEHDKMVKAVSVDFLD